MGSQASPFPSPTHTSSLGEGIGRASVTHPTAIPDGLGVAGGGQHTYSTPRKRSEPQGRSMPEPCRMSPWELQACRNRRPKGPGWRVAPGRRVQERWPRVRTLSLWKEGLSLLKLGDRRDGLLTS